MDKEQIQPLLDLTSTGVADFSIGFAGLSTEDGKEDANPAGSGSLCTIGNVRGILTAAHVLKYLPESGPIGIVRFFPSRESAPEKLTIDLERTEKLMISQDTFSEMGPDLGFLRLCDSDATSLETRNVFFNLEKRRDLALTGQKASQPYFDGLSGMIAEWTSELTPPRPSSRVKAFRGLFGVGLVVKTHESRGFDLFDFEVTYDPGCEAPMSYKGMSGGALWRVWLQKNSDDQFSVINKMIFGVAFHQSNLEDGKRIITCHGPKSVYHTLIDAVHEKWS